MLEGNASNGPPARDGPRVAENEAEVERLTLYADSQERKVGELQVTVSQLQYALDSRSVIDRAVGILAERFELPINDAFELLRSAARNSRRQVRALATELADSPRRTPDEITEAARRRARG